MRERPYDQHAGPCGRTVRTFSGSTDEQELRWHRDAHDRQVTFLTGAGWMIQVEPGLPLVIYPGMSMLIPRGTWHRLIRQGHESLRCDISEL